ncbi:MAG: hypothetical protein H6555_01135 [Lewinellaceae bacterium]|nr:hypothetical protein [Lewinellaceae bacterium]
MEKTRLVKALRRLNTRERTRFLRLVESPFFNVQADLSRLLAEILVFAPEFQHSALTKAEMYKRLFPGEPYQELRFNNLVSDLHQLLYRFLAELSMEQRPVTQYQFLLDTLLEREWHDLAPQALRRYAQLQEQETFRGEEYFRDQYMLHDKQDRLLVDQEKRSYQSSLQEKNNALDRFYHLEKLRIACDMTSRNRVLNAGYTCPFVGDILAFYTHNEEALLASPILRAYFQTYQLLTAAESDTYFNNLREDLSQYRRHFPEEELRSLYSYLLNYCVWQINSGRTHFYQEILHIYKRLLAEDLLLKQGNLSQWAYINIITAGIRLQDYSWTEEFIQTYRDTLLPQVRESVYTYNLANLYLEQGDYGRALAQLQEVEFTDAYYHLAAKIIQLKCYFILEESEALYSLLSATLGFIRRNRQLSEYQKQSNKRFVQWLRKLYQWKTMPAGAGGQGPGSAHWRQTLESEPVLANKQWLLAQMA